ncbi:MAG: peptide deformylase [Bacteroidetes bacterium]|jgi:peptide deformylase|nr:peptide deformylase [Bacteroidota bacterium]
MILPVYAYGQPVLRQKATEIDKDYPNLSGLIADMFETMYASNGIGLAAPQIGLGIRLFITDGSEIEDIKPEGFKQVFINPQIIEEFDEKWDYEEGCLSIPQVRADVNRHSKLVLRYFDENWQEHTHEFEGMAARIIQHEYDHIEGILFTDRIHPLKRTMLKSRLNNISQGRVNVSYKMKFAKK